ncbi:peptidoglycan-binding protein LysM [Lentisalinibacter sediminis]|uniref:peptidoglycan-binding protein LysM n=1 Tax=Lentisalinibacter sediminis TaxID=2992237 RepID=UPI00386AB056
MDLLGFAKDIGRRIFNKDEEAAEKIKELILQNNPGVRNLEVEFDQGVVGLSGECESGAAMQKCVLLAGNVEGVIDVYANKMTIRAPATAKGDTGDTGDGGGSTAEVAPAEEPVEFYTIRSGDTLSKIAKQYYGDAMKYPRIFEANREVIEDADKIYPGQRIRIPLG